MPRGEEPCRASSSRECSEPRGIPYLTGGDDMRALIDPDQSPGSYLSCITDTATHRHGVSPTTDGSAPLLIDPSVILICIPTSPSPCMLPLAPRRPVINAVAPRA